MTRKHQPTKKITPSELYDLWQRTVLYIAAANLDIGRLLSSPDPNLGLLEHLTENQQLYVMRLHNGVLQYKEYCRLRTIRLGAKIKRKAGAKPRS